MSRTTIGLIDRSELVDLDVRDILIDETQPRDDAASADIAELSDDIEARGLRYPLLVEVGSGENEGKYVLIGGERRLRGLLRRSIRKVTCRLTKCASEADRHAEQLLDDLHARRLGPMQRAKSVTGLLDAYSCTTKELAARLNIKHERVRRAVRLVKVVEELHGKVGTEKLPVKAAYRMGGLDEELQRAIWAELEVEDTLTLEQILAVIRRHADEARQKGPRRRRRRTWRGTRKSVSVGRGQRVGINSSRNLDVSQQVQGLLSAGNRLALEDLAERASVKCPQLTANELAVVLESLGETNLLAADSSKLVGELSVVALAVIAPVVKGGLDGEDRTLRSEAQAFLQSLGGKLRTKIKPLMNL